MQKDIIKILIVEDDPGDADFIKETLADQPDSFEIEWIDRLRTAMENLKMSQFDMVLLDLGLPDSQGLDTFNYINAVAPETPILILTGLNDNELAVRAVQNGAQDYLVKGTVTSELLGHTIKYAIERKKVQIESYHNERLRGALELAEGASHELSQPIQIIAGLVELISLETTNNKVLSEKIEIMKEQIYHISKWLHQLQHITHYRTKSYLGERIFDLGNSSKKRK